MRQLNRTTMAQKLKLLEPAIASGDKFPRPHMRRLADELKAALQSGDAESAAYCSWELAILMDELQDDIL